MQRDILPAALLAIVATSCSTPFTGQWRMPPEPALHQTLHLPSGDRIEYCEGDRRFRSSIKPHLRRTDDEGQVRWSLTPPGKADGDPDINPLAGAFFQNGRRDDSEVHLSFETVQLAADTRHLYIVQFCTIASGAELVALDLQDGQHVWGRAIVGLGPIHHSRYRNRVGLRLHEGQLIVSGHESGGDYVETYTTSGERLATTVLQPRER